MLETVRRFFERSRRSYAPVWQAWSEWRTQSRDDVEMLGYGWGHWLVFTFGMVLATLGVLGGIAGGAVAMLMKARNEVSGPKG